MNTSISHDMPDYLRDCKDIVEKNIVNFRCMPGYDSVVPGTQPKIDFYLNQIREKYSEMFPDLKIFWEGVSYGGVPLFDYEGVGRFESQTFRFVYALGQLIEWFGALNGMRICEVGPGFGMMFKIITDYCYGIKYTFVDLHYPLEIVKRHVNHLGREGLVDGYVECDNVEGIPVSAQWDLFISDCAFYECYRDIQEKYFDKIIIKCARGRIGCNMGVGPESVDKRMSPEEMLSRIPCKSKRLFKTPDRYEMVVWGENV
jgi:hypothetical protein